MEIHFAGTVYATPYFFYRSAGSHQRKSNGAMVMASIYFVYPQYIGTVTDANGSYI
jgi:hypothetical protein